MVARPGSMSSSQDRVATPGSSSNPLDRVVGLGSSSSSQEKFARPDSLSSSHDRVASSGSSRSPLDRVARPGSSSSSQDRVGRPGSSGSSHAWVDGPDDISHCRVEDSYQTRVDISEPVEPDTFYVTLSDSFCGFDLVKCESSSVDNFLATYYAPCREKSVKNVIFKETHRKGIITVDKIVSDVFVEDLGSNRYAVYKSELDDILLKISEKNN